MNRTAESKLKHRKADAERLRSLVFGVEDSLASTIGFVSGIAASGAPNSAVLLSGAVLVFVEAFSMSVGELLSSNSAQEFEEQRSVPWSASLASGLVMLVSYILSGLLILAPYMLLDANQALTASVFISLAALFLLGAASATFSHGNRVRKGFIMFLMGGVTIAIGILIGTALSPL